MSDSVTDVSTLLYIVEVALAARTLYGFCRTYFTHKLTAHDVTTTVPRQRLTPKRPVIVYMDGCFDVMHFGHANALRQARALGDILVVGVCPESEIRIHKGPPVMSDRERQLAVESVKWVQKVLVDVPYVLTSKFLNAILEQHRVDVIVHGDDPCLGVDGEDVYRKVKEMGRFRSIKRTEGVSSTDIVSRMLSCTRDHHVANSSAQSSSDATSEAATATLDNDATPADPPVSTFLPTTRRLVEFAGETRSPRPGDRVVYIDGTFDMFHAAHIETLRKARQLGNFLLVGIHDDATVNRRKGSNFPIMNVHERTLMVLSSRYVDEVIIGAPWVITKDMITSMNISVVVHGSYHHDAKRSGHNFECMPDPYSVARELDLVRQVDSTFDLSVEKILQRIVRNRVAFEKRNLKKVKSELEYFTKQKKYVQET